MDKFAQLLNDPDACKEIAHRDLLLAFLSRDADAMANASSRLEAVIRMQKTTTEIITKYQNNEFGCVGNFFCLLGAIMVDCHVKNTSGTEFHLTDRLLAKNDKKAE